MQRSSALRRTKGPERRTGLRRSRRLKRRKPLGRSRVSPASEAQRAKVAGRACLVCGGWPVDPAHLVPRSLGGCDEPDCVVPLCRRCHRAFDDRGLELLPYLEPRWRLELAHALSHLPLLALVRRVTREDWPGRGGEDRRARA